MPIRHASGSARVVLLALSPDIPRHAVASPLTVTPSFGLSQQIQVLWNAHILKQMARIRADYVPQPHINQVGGLTYQ